MLNKRLNAFNENGGRKRFGNIFVNTRFKARKQIKFLCAGGEHNYRKVACFPNFLCERPTVKLGHHNIDYRKRNIRVFIKKLKRLSAVGRGQHFIAANPQKIRNQLYNSLFIIGNKNFFLIHSSSSLN